MKQVIILLTSLIFYQQSLAQEAVERRMIFIGDAGEINHQQQALIPAAAELVIPGKTTVVFLGDNIYPRGMGLPGSKEQEHTRGILRSQFTPMRAKNAPVYFIPGNHDWDKMGKQGLAKIREQGKFLEEQNDPLLRLIPANGCPDPVDIVLSDSLVMIAWDSEWWLFPHQRSSDDVECECNTEEQVLEKLSELRYRHQTKTILLAGHHPFQSYGVHGGYYSLKDHLFPLTAVNKHLYIPLPVIGSLYPLLRQTVFLNPEDIPHPAYKNMISEVRNVFSNFGNIIYVSGHDHGLQIIKDERFLQIVSGSGAKDSYIRKGQHTLFSHPDQGFVIIDYLRDRNSRITCYTYADDGVREAFSYIVPYQDFIKQNAPAQMTVTGQDSLTVKANEKFDQAGPLHRKLFGENYRKEWATPAKVPVIQISSFQGGLRPVQRGGGMQSVTLRLEDPTGKQWVIRSVNKRSEALLPKGLHHTFAHDFLDDATSAQHPYSALMVPPLANALNIPHAKPIIGIIAPDSALGPYNDLFANTLCLLEEREPLGDSDNTPKMLRKVYNDNDDIYKAKTFVRARMLDLLISDWDRHEDQWRWYDEQQHEKGADKDYVGIPRDRDQALRINDGILPKIASMPFLLPTMQGFSPEIKSVKYSLFKSDFLNAHPKNQFSSNEWQELVKDFVRTMTDSVLEESIRQLPANIYPIRNEEILHTLKKRRDAIPEEMDKYFRFTNSIVDIRSSNKNEKVIIEDAPGKALRVMIRKINKEGLVTRKLMDNLYDPAITKEIRVYLANGDDSLQVNAPESSIKIRVIGGSGKKDYQVTASGQAVSVYDTGIQSTFTGNKNYLRKYIDRDSSHTAFVPVNLYNVWVPKAAAGYNLDDGILLGAGFRYIHQRGFRKSPFTHIQELVVSGAVATGAVRVKYNGHWKKVLGKADLLAELQAYMPTSQNFFGLGNDSRFEKDLHMPKYYRTRFSLFEASASLLWHPNETSRLKFGPAMQVYYTDPDHNTGRFIKKSHLLHTYDSLTIHKEKFFGGFTAGYEKDNRNRKLMPSRGGYFKSEIKGFAGLNHFARSYAQFTSEMAIYGSIAGDALIIANRTGGGMTWGSPAFFQALYLGGQGNLRGFRQFRFAGEHMLYNNLEVRIKIIQIGSYILPGQLGALVFYDAGKVWANGHNSRQIHQGTGGGLYFAPAGIAVIQAVAGHSREGWHPYISIGFRF